MEEIPETRPSLDSEHPDIMKSRFVADIDSTHYYSLGGELFCAVLIRVANLLDVKTKLVRAEIPLSILPSEEESESSLHISEFFPRDEIVEIRKRQDNETTISPTVSISSSGPLLQFSGIDVGVSESSFYGISLTGYHHDSHPVNVTWALSDPKCIYYPSQIKLLLVVSNKGSSHASSRASWFPFQLRVGPIALSARRNPFGSFKYTTRFKSDAFTFHIHGQFHPRLADAALNDARESTVPKFVGLKAAVLGYKTIGE